MFKPFLHILGEDRLNFFVGKNKARRERPFSLACLCLFRACSGEVARRIEQGSEQTFIGAAGKICGEADITIRHGLNKF